jgi:hypothetical protein
MMTNLKKEGPDGLTQVTQSEEDPEDEGSCSRQAAEDGQIQRP